MDDEELTILVDELAAAGDFSGVVSIERDGRAPIARAHGWADRAWRIPNQVGTRFAIASGVKTMTALTVVSLVVEGLLELATPARAYLGDDLPLVADDVTVEHLLAHRSGIGDYIDEDDELPKDGYTSTVPVHRLVATDDYLEALDGHATKFAAGSRFSYSNSGYVVLALVAERASSTPFHELVDERVCVPAGMADTEFLRSDELPGGVATGYLHADGLRTNVLHLPVRGNGDGGIYTTTADVSRFWRAVFGGRIVPMRWVEQMTRPVSSVSATWSYGLGFWIDGTGAPSMEGADAGVSFRSTFVPPDDRIVTVVSNTTGGAWPMLAGLAEALDG